MLKKVSLTQWILFSMVLGVALGVVFPDGARAAHAGWAASDLNFLSNIFLRMIKSLIGPLIFSTLIVGIAGHGDDMKRVGKLALRSIIYFEVVTTLALAVGLIAVNLVKPGAGVVLGGAAPTDIEQLSKTQITLGGVLEHVVPQSVVQAAATNDVLQIVFWAIIFAVALSRVPGQPRKVMLGVLESLSEIMFKFTAIVMGFAPVGIGAAIAATVSKSGLGVLKNLGVLVLTLYGSLVVFALLVLIPVAILFRVPIKRFLRAVKEPFLIAFSTSSSEAALPPAMEAMERFGVPQRIVAFVMPTGYSFNLDGSTLYLAIASVFVAQAAGIDLPLSQQLLMMVTLMLTSKGVAAVPRASLVILSGALASFGLPLQGVAVILGVDALMDMARTSINLVGNCLASAVMARWEGELGEEQLPGLGSVVGEPVRISEATAP